MGLGLEVVIVLLLIVVNGVFSMSELALVSVRRARLAVLERKGLPGATTARELAEDPQRFLPTVQVGITLVGMLAGVFGGARIAADLKAWLVAIPMLDPAAETLSLALVVVVTTYLTMVLGELVPKQLALRRPEQMAAWVAPADRLDGAGGGPVVWLLDKSSAFILRLFGLHRAPRQTVTEEELKALLAEGAQAGVLEIEERDMIERVLRLADKPVRAIMTPRTEIAWIDRTDPPHGDRGDAEIRAAFAFRGVRRRGGQRGRRGAGEGHPGPHPGRRRALARRGTAPADGGARTR